MASPPIFILTPEKEIHNFKQRERESLKDAWHRICNAQYKATRKLATSFLLRNFYVGITPWNRCVLDMATGGDFMSSHTFDAYNAMLDLFGPPPLLVNGTVLTLEHVMQRLNVIENKFATVELIENLDKKIHNHITQLGSRVGVTLKNLKEKEPIVNEKIDLDSSRISKLEVSLQTWVPHFPHVKHSKTPFPKLPSLFMFLKIRGNLLVKETRISNP